MTTFQLLSFLCRNNRRILLDVWDFKKVGLVETIGMMRVMAIVFGLGFLVPIFWLPLRVIRRPVKGMSFLQLFRFYWDQPLRSPIHGAVLNGYIDYMQKFLRGETRFRDTKLHWRDLFLKNGLLTPKVYLVIDGSEPAPDPNQLPPRDLCVKPNIGGRGGGIRILKYDPQTQSYDGVSADEFVEEQHRYFRDAPTVYRNLQSTLVMEVIKPHRQLPFSDRNQSVRITTIRKKGGNAEYFSALCVRANSSDSIVSNHARGGDLFDATGGKVDEAELPFFWDAVEQCKKLHNDPEVANILSIGWDVMLTDDGPSFLEGNLPHGLIGSKSDDLFAVTMDFIRAAELDCVPAGAPSRGLAADLCRPASEISA